MAVFSHERPIPRPGLAYGRGRQGNGRTDGQRTISTQPRLPATWTGAERNGPGMWGTWKANGLELSVTLNELLATLGCSGLSFWPTWLSR